MAQMQIGKWNEQWKAVTSEGSILALAMIDRHPHPPSPPNPGVILTRKRAAVKKYDENTCQNCQNQA